MMQRLLLVAALILTLAVVCAGQNSNSSAPAPASRPRTQAPPPPPPAQTTTPGGTQTNNNSGGQSRSTRRNTGDDATSKGVVDAFDSLIAGIEKADVNLVTNVYWNSPQLTLFNYNGTVTRGWEQMRKNRESSYPNIKDAKLEVRDRRVLMVARDAAVVTCLWTQTQTYKGTPETASGRMTLIFQRINGAWKAVHLHTSPDAPDASRLPPSEQTTEQPKPRQE